MSPPQLTGSIHSFWSNIENATIASRGSPLVLNKVSPRKGRNVMAERTRMVHRIVLAFLLRIIIIRFCYKSSKKSEKSDNDNRKSELLASDEGGFVAVGSCAFDEFEHADEVREAIEAGAVGDVGNGCVAHFEKMASTIDTDSVEVGDES